MKGVLAWPTHASIWKERVNVIVIKLCYSVYKKQGVDHNEKRETGFGDMMWDGGWGGGKGSTRPCPTKWKQTIDSACPSHQDH